MKLRLMVTLLALCMALGMLPRWARAAEQTTVYASTTTQLKAALKSNTKIVLEGKDYLVRSNLELNDLENVTIQGTAGTRIISLSESSEVISTFNCKNLVLDNLVLGHDIDVSEDGCTDGVIVAYNTELNVTNCDIFGCGRLGIEASYSTVTVENSIIRDCSQKILYLSGKGSATFRDCVFSGNGYKDPDKYAITNMSEGLAFYDCTFKDNDNPYFVSNPTSYTVENCISTNNGWGDGGTPEIISGECGDNLTWTLEGGTLSISGTGSMWDWDLFAPWHNEWDIIQTVEISNEVTNIGCSAFYRCDKLTSIDIPDSVTSIGDNAFMRCGKLTNIDIPNSVTSIGESAFFGCYGLSGITIPDGVASIGEHAFTNCSLTSVTIPNSITSILDGTFAGCDRLTSITIPGSVTSIGESAFSGCTSLSSITIPDSVTNIGSEAFMSCHRLTSITIPNSITSIGEKVFSVCSGLTSITIPDSVTSIGDNAFSRCSSLTSITIPDSVTHIGDHAFRDCYLLKKVYYSGTKEQWGKIKIDDTKNGNAPLLNATIHYNSDVSDEPKPGDLTGDGKVTMVDVLRLARGAASYVTLTEQEQKAGDVTGDGKITMADVIRVARSAAGYNPTL